MEKIDPVFRRIMDDLNDMGNEIDRIQGELQKSLDARITRLREINDMTRENRKKSTVIRKEAGKQGTKQVK